MVVRRGVFLPIITKIGLNGVLKYTKMVLFESKLNPVKLHVNFSGEFLFCFSHHNSGCIESVSHNLCCGLGMGEFLQRDLN